MLEIGTLDDFKIWLANNDNPPAALQDLPLRTFSAELKSRGHCGNLFLGCELTAEATVHIVRTGGVVIPDNHRFTFPAHMADLYTPAQMFKGYDPDRPGSYHDSYDYKVYEEYVDHGREEVTIDVSLHRRLHDHSITEALDRHIAGQKVVAVMGGHAMERADVYYRRIARITRDLARRGMMVVTGGGPGAMEAAHLGAFLAPLPDDALERALGILTPRPEGALPGKEYLDPDWLDRSWRVKTILSQDLPRDCAVRSIGIPTWFYGHEPPSPFPCRIAKYFANSVREEGLLMIARQGVIFAPGSAGTVQEIFQDAAQNHYHTAGHASPMILFGREYWTETLPVWSVLRKLSEGHDYKKLIRLSDEPDEITRMIAGFAPR